MPVEHELQSTVNVGGGAHRLARYHLQNDHDDHMSQRAASKIWAWLSKRREPYGELKVLGDVAQHGDGNGRVVLSLLRTGARRLNVSARSGLIGVSRPDAQYSPLFHDQCETLLLGRELVMQSLRVPLLQLDTVIGVEGIIRGDVRLVAAGVDSG
jgi:hypothetical protein